MCTGHHLHYTCFALRSPKALNPHFSSARSRPHARPLGDIYSGSFNALQCKQARGLQGPSGALLPHCQGAVFVWDVRGGLGGGGGGLDGGGAGLARAARAHGTSGSGPRLTCQGGTRGKTMPLTSDPVASTAERTTDCTPPEGMRHMKAVCGSRAPISRNMLF